MSALCRFALVALALCGPVGLGCGAGPSTPAPVEEARGPPEFEGERRGGGEARARRTRVPLLSALSLPPVPGAADALDNGEDDGSPTIEPSHGLRALAVADRARFAAIPAPAGAHPLICDLAPLDGALFAAFAVAPISRDGARVYRFDPALPPARAWTLALDWDRGGAPGVTHEQGGQGITRLRVIDGRVYATDADAPRFGGFGITAAPLEGYVFASRPDGTFPPLGPGMSPPAGTRLVPWAFHVFDVIRYRGALVATGGSVTALAPPRRRARYPGALFAAPAGDAQALLEPRFRPGDGQPIGVVRTTYLHRFGGRLYVGFQNNGGRIGWDLAVLTGDPFAPATPAPVIARVTPEGGWLTARFASTADTLYWLAARHRRPRGQHRPGALFRSRDGLRFERVVLPADAGPPQDLVIVDGVRYLLTPRGLYRARADDVYALLAPAPPGDPFGRGDGFCSAPLVAAADALYAGSTRDGALYRITAARGAAAGPSR